MSETLEANRKYVCGFMFDEPHYMHEVLLIEKQRPDWQRLKLNGVGGRVEDGESEHEAMRREFQEETGMDHDGWNLFCVLQDGRGWPVYFFHTMGDIRLSRSTTDEQLVRVPMVSLHVSNVMPNLRWLLPMARSMRHERIDYFEITERTGAGRGKNDL